MTSMTTETAVTNGQIARDLKLSDSMVSRIRSGDRLPSFATMQVIERVYNWSLPEQARYRVAGDYAKAFAYRVGQHYAE